MIVCPKCNKELNDGAKFCGNCGTQIQTPKVRFCPNCGTQTTQESVFCSNCGASATEKPVVVQPAAAQSPAEKVIKLPKIKKPLSKREAMLGGIALVVVAAIMLAIFLLPGRAGKKQENSYILYLRDQEIFFADLKSNSDAWQLTTRLIDTDTIDAGELATSAFYLGLLTYVSDNGKYIFFPDKVGEDEGFNLYYRELANPNGAAVKIDSYVVSYTVNSSATVITYLKSNEGNLYQYKINDGTKEKIASEVRGYSVSDDGSKIGYINSEGSIYLKYANRDKEKLASEVTSLEYLSEDFTTVYYIKEDALYRQEEGKDRVKIASGVYDVLQVYESGEIYFLTKDSTEISLLDYVTDDMKDTDATITEPSSPQYPTAPSSPSWFDYSTDAEYQVAYNAYLSAYETYEAECDRLYAEYQTAYEAYRAKSHRDSLRIELQDETLSRSSYTLCYYNGMEATVITDAYIGDYYPGDYVAAADVPVISYEAYNQANLSNVKISEIESISDVKNMVKAALFSSSERYITVKTNTTIIEQEKEAGCFNINDSGTLVYYIDDVPDEKNYGELYCVSIVNGVVGKPQVYDSDVYTGRSYFMDDNQFVYFKDYKDGNGELYINKKNVDYDVRVYSIDYYDSLGKVFYSTDWNSEKEYGTLKVYQDGKAIKIADDVHNYSVTNDGRVFYLYDYSINYYKGELREWDNGQSKKIDDDVAAVLPIFNNKYRGYSYNW